MRFKGIDVEKIYLFIRSLCLISEETLLFRLCHAYITLQVYISQSSCQFPNETRGILGDRSGNRIGFLLLKSLCPAEGRRVVC